MIHDDYGWNALRKPEYVKWKRVGNHDLPMPCRKTEGAAGFDLSTVLWRELSPEPKKVGLGWAVEIPRGYVGLLVGRSGPASRGITCHVGTIDSDYRGELTAMAWTVTGERLRIDPGERIAQLLIVPCLMVESVEATELSETARGSGGFGSTGR